MMSQVVSKFPMIWLTCVGLLLFMSVFIGALAWVSRRGSTGFYEEMSKMPLDEVKS